MLKGHFSAFLNGDPGFVPLRATTYGNTSNLSTDFCIHGSRQAQADWAASTAATTSDCGSDHDHNFRASGG